MQLHGKNFVAADLSAEGSRTFRGVDPSTGASLDPAFTEATPAEIDRAMDAARAAFEAGRSIGWERHAAFLTAVAEEIVALGDELLHLASRETGLPVEPRLAGERTRTAFQLTSFADVVRDGSWVQACVDTAIPDRKPQPKPDVRQMLIPLGPVVAFGASNFPLAYSVAGVDPASAWAAGCPVVVKAHPAHPGTSELTAVAIRRAVEKTGMPPGWFSMLHGPSPEVGTALVKHPHAKAVGFTGSLRGGRALFDAAAARPEPIPVYAEMGSTNPIFLLPGALAARGEQIAEGLKASVTTGAGQFCTKPGIVVGLRDAQTDTFVRRAAELISQVSPTTMLHAGIRDAYDAGVKRWTERTKLASPEMATVEPSKTHGAAAVFETDARAFLRDPVLGEEVFGPATLVVRADTLEELEEVARNLHGQLTASVHGTPEDLAQATPLIRILEEKAGRLIFNGFPTGVEVCPSMHHGGPYPATTDSKFTSVGALAIKRYARPVCYQGFPQDALPAELRDDNPRGIWRLVNSRWTRDAV
jgi:NADP-dependent aldehyde dehydrogenase